MFTLMSWNNFFGVPIIIRAFNILSLLTLSNLVKSLETSYVGVFVLIRFFLCLSYGKDVVNG